VGYQLQRRRGRATGITLNTIRSGADELDWDEACNGESEALVKERLILGIYTVPLPVENVLGGRRRRCAMHVAALAPDLGIP
jgi:hypothetical protein